MKCTDEGYTCDTESLGFLETGRMARLRMTPLVQRMFLKS